MQRRSNDWFREVVEDDPGTAGDSVALAPVPAATRTAATLLTEDADDLRRRVKTLSVDIGENHQRIYEQEWQVLTQGRSTQSVVDLLNELAELGFAWRDVARLVGVSVPAIQKWRKGERASSDNRRKIASLLAACDFIASHYYVDDIGSWFEMRIIESAPVTPVDLWASGHQMLFFEYVTRHLSPEDTLQNFDPEWRERYRTSFTTFRDEDGHLGLRMQE
ncbi:MAG TPA: helix-turn-helix transcriptional regulator [Actinophytocola sp.]|uniref:helix-turn-helix domain-containing protein n=1 Tax=Actinophytocola sp. TaxID=1872138 RepID=UPI002E0C49DE|nr:helix-turn-helix transcriptional regulator [Actinophytocola sp.]